MNKVQKIKKHEPQKQNHSKIEKLYDLVEILNKTVGVFSQKQCLCSCTKNNPDNGIVDCPDLCVSCPHYNDMVDIYKDDEPPFLHLIALLNRYGVQIVDVGNCLLDYKILILEKSIETAKVNNDFKRIAKTYIEV